MYYKILASFYHIYPAISAIGWMDMNILVIDCINITSSFRLLIFISDADVNECQLNAYICGVGTCMNTQGSYTCMCPQGFMFMSMPTGKNCMGRYCQCVLLSPDGHYYSICRSKKVCATFPFTHIASQFSQNYDWCNCMQRWELMHFHFHRYDKNRH